MKAVIYTQRVEVIENYDERRDCADQRIAEFIVKCGYLPIPLPNRSKLAEEAVKCIKPVGIILTGGNSLCEYGGNAPERDEMDDQMIKLAIEKNIPLYGICRGMQSILHFFDCKLQPVEGHVAVRHEIYGKYGKFSVNSYHNLGCREIDKNNPLKVTMKGFDGVTEAIIHKDMPIMGTMWHPEREPIFSEEDILMVCGLLEGNLL